MSVRNFRFNKPKASLTTLALSIFLLIPLLLLEKESALAFVIEQESTYANGVWVSHPLPCDERILSFFNENNIQTIEDYARWLQANITYEQNSRDHWAPPEKTIETRHGDCKDYAFLNAEVLKVFGYKPHIFALTQRAGNHAVCAFEKDGYFLWFDNNCLKESNARNLKELAQDILLQYNFSSLLEYQVSSQRWQVLFKAS